MSRLSPSVNIRPGVSMLGVLSHLNYSAWYALAEFVDNALQSYLSNRERLLALHGPEFCLRVDIELDTSADPRLVIRDNAAGIASRDYQRAFRPAEIPPNRNGLAEFGMGMKSAACWFSPKWSVRTSALGEPVQRIVRLDVHQIVEQRVEEIAVQERPADQSAHFTEIVLEQLHRPPQTKTVTKIKEHLADIYRVFTREGQLDLRFNGEPLVYAPPEVLVAPYFVTPDAEPVEWKREIEFPLGNGMSVHGFAAIRKTASTSRAGFSLFRRGRVIQGSGDEGYRPEAIFGRSNSYRYQRVFGELHLEGFQVSHTKDGIRWDENEEPFLELLKEHLDAAERPLLKQAEGYRALASRDKLEASARRAVERTGGSIRDGIGDALNDASARPDPPPELSPQLPGPPPLAREQVREVEWHGKLWEITIELTDDAGVGDWLTLTGTLNDAVEGKIGIRVSLAHPFMHRFGGASAENIEPFLRIATAIALSEVVARDSGVRRVGRVRQHINELLAGVLGQP